MHHMIDYIIKYYCDIQFPGTKTEHTDVSQLTPAPPPGVPDRVAWKTEHQARGPIGLFLQNAHQAGCCLDVDFYVHQHNELAFPIFRIPWQTLGPAVQCIATRARIVATPERETFDRLHGIDDEVLSMARKHIPSQDIPLLNSISSGAFWTQENKNHIDPDQDAKCSLCGDKSQNMLHTIIDCTALQHIRCQYKPLIDNIDLAKLPRSLLLI